MQVENDPNVIYGGDVDVLLLKKIYASLGEMIVFNLRKGLDKPAFVSSKLTKRQKKAK